LRSCSAKCDVEIEIVKGYATRHFARRRDFGWLLVA
jgi:hypothetical protein